MNTADTPDAKAQPGQTQATGTQNPDELAQWLEAEARALEPVLQDPSASVSARQLALARIQALRQEAALWRARQLDQALASSQPLAMQLSQATAQAREALQGIQRWQGRLHALALVLEWAAAWRGGQVAQGLAATAALRELAKDWAKD